MVATSSRNCTWPKLWIAHCITPIWKKKSISDPQNYKTRGTFTNRHWKMNNLRFGASISNVDVDEISTTVRATSRRRLRQDASMNHSWTSVWGKSNLKSLPPLPDEIARMPAKVVDSLSSQAELSPTRVNQRSWGLVSDKLRGDVVGRVLRQLQARRSGPASHGIQLLGGNASTPLRTNSINLRKTSLATLLWET